MTNGTDQNVENTIDKKTNEVKSSSVNTLHVQAEAFCFSAEIHSECVYIER